jgi:hypothetical protein
MKLTKRQKEIIYFVLSRVIDNESLSPKEFAEIDYLRSLFYFDKQIITRKKKKKGLQTKYTRKVWTINPKTRVKGNDKHYKRPKAKQEFRRELERGA